MFTQGPGGHGDQEPVGRERRKTVREFLGQNGRRHHISATASELFRYGKAHPAQFGKTFPEVFGNFSRPVQFPDTGFGQLLLKKSSDTVA